jgi:integration host factor subunit alpha
MPTLTRARIADSLHANLGLSKAETMSLVDRVLQMVAERLEAGDTVKLSGFGTFGVRRKAARQGRNPATMEAAPISPRTVVTFRPSDRLRQALAPGSPGAAGWPVSVDDDGHPDLASRNG